MSSARRTGTSSTSEPRRETLLGAALEHVREAVLVVDGDGVILELSPAAAHALGRPAERLVGSRLTAAVDQGDRDALQGAVRSGAPTQVDLHVAGEARQATLSPIGDGVVVALDGPYRAEAAQELVLERLPFAALVVDQALHVVFANAAAHRLFGDEAVEHGTTLGQSSTRALLPLARSVVAGTAAPHSSIVESDGRTLRALGVRATTELPGMLFVDEPPSDVHHERVMRGFLRNAAHQLRTPLAGIMAAVETLQSGAKERPADRDRFLLHIESHAERLARIARGLLLLARAETGETLEVDAVPLIPMVDAIVAEADPRAGVVVRADCADVAAVASPDLLRETIAALVDNAVAYTEAGEVTVSASASGGTVVVRVSDTGPGIPDELHSRIFEPFFRVATTGEGYGLGLAIAREAVRAMQGEITVSSTAGAGTTFTVALPAAWTGT